MNDVASAPSDRGGDPAHPSVIAVVATGRITDRPSHHNTACGVQLSMYKRAAEHRPEWPKWGHIGATIGGETMGTEGNRSDANLQLKGYFVLSALVPKPPQSVLKTVGGATRPWVRIPPLPPIQEPLRA